MRFIDAALADPMGAYLLLWMWRVIYVTQNNKIFPNVHKNVPVIYIPDIPHMEPNISLVLQNHRL